MISHSTTSKPGTSRGRSASVAGSVASSLRHGIWMMSFMRGRAGATGRAERSTPYTRWRPVSHMASATITRPAPGPDPAAGRRSRLRSWPVLALAVLALGTLIGFLVYPTYPNYDSYYSLLWGRELLHGIKPSFDGYRTPTEHPLAVAFGLVLSILGDPADRVMVGATLVSFVVLAAGALPPGRGLVRDARRAGGRRPAVHALRLPLPGRARLHRHPLPGLRRVGRRARGRAPAPRHRRLRAAGLRGAHAPGGMAAERPVLAVVRAGRIVAAAHPLLGAHRRSPPVIWTALDWWATGDPKFSLTHTSGLAEELGRTSGGLSAVPSTTVKFLKNLDKVPVFYAGILGVVIARRCSRRGARACRWRCWSSAWAPSCSSASPGCRSSTATCSCPRCWSWSSRRSRSGAGRCCAPGARATLWAVALGRAHHLRRGLHGHPGQLLDLHQRADLPRRLARLAAHAAQRPEGARRAALRPGVDAQPQAHPRHALAARRARAQGHRPQRRAASARGSSAAWRSTRSRPPGAAAPGFTVGDESTEDTVRTRCRCRASRGWPSRRYYGAYVRC